MRPVKGTGSSVQIDLCDEEAFEMEVKARVLKTGYPTERWIRLCFSLQKPLPRVDNRDEDLVKA